MSRPTPPTRDERDDPAPAAPVTPEEEPPVEPPVEPPAEPPADDTPVVVPMPDGYVRRLADADGCVYVVPGHLGAADVDALVSRVASVDPGAAASGTISHVHMVVEPAFDARGGERYDFFGNAVAGDDDDASARESLPLVPVLYEDDGNVYRLADADDADGVPFTVLADGAGRERIQNVRYERRAALDARSAIRGRVR